MRNIKILILTIFCISLPLNIYAEECVLFVVHSKGPGCTGPSVWYANLDEYTYNPNTNQIVVTNYDYANCHYVTKYVGKIYIFQNGDVQKQSFVGYARNSGKLKNHVHGMTYIEQPDEPTQCPEPDRTCQERKGEYAGFFTIPGKYDTRVCKEQCFVSLSYKPEGLGGNIVFTAKDPDKGWETFGYGYYTGEECMEGFAETGETEPSTCNEYKQLCRNICLDNISQFQCPNDTTGQGRVCDCVGKVPPIIDLADGNGFQPDSDLDGIPNDQDPDIDGDGKPNAEDRDTDGDGIPNVSDSDNNDNGISNGGNKGWGADRGTDTGLGADPDVDGDGTSNGSDPDVDGDGLENGLDPDIDGDGLPNSADLDADGDGVPNGSDPDADGDGLLNGDDIDASGIISSDGDSDGDGVQEGEGEEEGEGDEIPKLEENPEEPKIDLKKIRDAYDKILDKAPFNTVSSLKNSVSQLSSTVRAPRFTINLGLTQIDVNFAFLSGIVSGFRSIISFFLILMTSVAIIFLYRDM